MTITLREFVGQEIIYCVSSLVSDLSTLLQDASGKTLNRIGYNWEEDILPLLEMTDYEEAGRAYIAKMDRDELIEALDDAHVKDARDQHQIAEAAAEYAMEEDLLIEDWHTWWEDFTGVPDEQLRFLLESDVDNQDDGWKEFCQQQGVDTDDFRSEVYEHWIVTDWLAKHLAARGEVTGELMGLTIWGRRTTGQSISMDYVIQKIYKELTGRDVTSADY